VLYQAGLIDEAVMQLEQLVEESPKLNLGHSLLGHAYLQQKRFDHAIREYGKQTVHAGRFGDLGYAYAVAGKTSEAHKELAQLKEWAKKHYVAPYHLAVIYAGLGEKANALAGLEDAYEDRSTLLVWIKVDPRLDTLRSEPRFREILERMKLQ
jgi:tetratricopeptide (TPR) repeat protein